MTRQVLANDARRLLPLIRAAYDVKDRTAFHERTAEWVRDMQLEDTLLGTNEYFLLGRWLSYVPAWVSSPSDLEHIEYDAHSILTTWGDRTASTSLHEYGNRDWAGLVRSYYEPRWKMYFQSLDEALDKGVAPKEIDWYAFRRCVEPLYRAVLLCADRRHLRGKHGNSKGSRSTAQGGAVTTTRDPRFCAND